MDRAGSGGVHQGAWVVRNGLMRSIPGSLEDSLIPGVCVGQGQPANQVLRNRKTSGTSSWLLPEKSAAQQGLGWQLALATILVAHWLVVVMLHAPVVGLQHAPVVTAQDLGAQTIPKPRNFRPCCAHPYCVLTTHAAWASLQHPPLAQGFGRHVADANHVPEQFASVTTEQELARVQHAPVVSHGAEEQLAPACHMPPHAASVAWEHPPCAVLQHAPMGGQRSAVQGCAG